MPAPAKRKPANRVPKAFRISASVERDLRKFARTFTKGDPTGRVWTQTDVVEFALTQAAKAWHAGATPWPSDHAEVYPAPVTAPSREGVRPKAAVGAQFGKARPG